MSKKVQQAMGLDIAGALTSLSQRSSLPDAIMQLGHNSIDAGARIIKVVLHKKRDGTSISVVDDGYGMFRWIPQQDEDIITAIQSGELILQGESPADKMTEVTSCISYPFMMAFPAASMKRSRVYHHLLELFTEGGGRAPAVSIGTKAIGILETISKCQQVEIRSKAHVYLAQHHYNNTDLSQSDVPVSTLLLPTQEALRENRRESEMWDEPGEIIDPITEQVIPHGTIVTLHNITESDWWLSTERLASTFARALGRLLADDLIKFEFWTIEEVSQRTPEGRKSIPQRKRINVKSRVQNESSIYRRVVETSNGYIADVRIWIRKRGDDGAIVFARAGVPGDPVAEILGFDGIWADTSLTGYVEIMAPPEHDFDSWDQDKRQPMPSYPPMRKALDEVASMRVEILEAIEQHEIVRSSTLLTTIGQICQASLLDILVADDELVHLMELPQTKPAATRRDRKGDTSRKENTQKGVRVRVKNEHGEAVPNELGVKVSLVRWDKGMRDDYATAYPRFGNINFGEVEQGRYRINIEIPEGMEIIAPVKNEPFVAAPGTPVFKTFVLRTHLPSRAQNKIPAVKFEFHADQEDGPLVDLIDLESLGKVYINIGAPLFKQSYGAKDSVRLAEAIAYPVIFGVFQLAYKSLDAYLLDRAVRIAQALASNIEPELKNSLRRN